MLYIPPVPTIIHTASPEEEIWHCINELTDYSHVNYLLDYRLNKSNCFSRFRQHFESLVELKDRFNRENRGKKGETKIHQLLSDKKEIESNAEEITILAKQAIELYKSSQNSSIYAKPLLLYYSYIKLERILFLSTYKSAYATRGHGLSYSPDNKCIICHRDGAFVRFHDSYNWDPTIYLNGCTFRWIDLLLTEPTDLVLLILNMKRGNIIRLNDNISHTYIEHELTREIIFTFAMNALARYHVKEWNELIEAKEMVDGIDPRISIISKIQEYLRSTQSLFPNLIYNQLWGTQYFFYPSNLDLMDITEVNPERLNWSL